MWKRLALSGAVLVGLTDYACAASAVVADAAFSVTGSAPQICAVNTPTLTNSGVQNIRSLSGSSLQIDQLVDPQTLASRAASAQVSFDAVCTFPHRVVIQSQGNGLWRNQTSGLARPPGFADAVPYLARLEWSGSTNELNADASSRGLVQTTAAVGQASVGALVIDFSILSGASNLTANAPLLAGVYSDTLTVTLEPQ